MPDWNMRPAVPDSLNSAIEVIDTAVVPIEYTPDLVVVALFSKVDRFFYQLPWTDAEAFDLYNQIGASKTAQIDWFSLLGFTDNKEAVERFMSVRASLSVVSYASSALAPSRSSVGH